MSLNDLLHRHQVSLMQAQFAPTVAARRTHATSAAGYADRVAAMVTPAGATTAPLARA